MEPNLLLTPGPTPIPPQVTHAMSAGMIGHRSSDFTSLMEDVQSNIRTLFGTDHSVAILTSSGTSALEASMINLIEPEDAIVIIVSGAFGDRFRSIAKTYPYEVHTYEVPWGEGLDIEDFKAFLTGKTDIKAVFSQACETSTAVVHPINELGQLVKSYSPDTLFVVDGVSAVGGMKFDMEADAIDCLVTGSQKALMLPPGLAFVAMNETARARAANNPLSRFYLDINKYFDALEAHSTPFTPAVSLIQGLAQVLSLYKAEGVEKVFERHLSMRNMLRAGLEALDLELLVDDAYASPTVTAFRSDEAELAHIKDALKKKHGITIAGGQKHLKGQILRIGHMGYMFPKDMLTVLAALEAILSDYRNQQYYGKALAAAQEAYYE
ncbi:alanine--glyoxylate aminotransferase family protein [Salinicoccus cyprini]|uniref:Alanine--glyoxylate aminotransferase family protein n=1 Tax=Salinicoccus cyprini TaxID=2493691 RepID=A0A558AV97_9STAP|nr:alanine--glyoxylate aminotransferase family protein [Salinicoccus cyprini]TVT28181.1 alanine--glyoxylate aminotransferase family protein [Salinicoccus cyprini]